MKINHPINPSDKILNKLIKIYFRKCYNGFGENTKEDEDYISQTFKLKVTDKTKNNGYNGYDSDRLELYKEYTLDFMDVSRSSSYLRLKEMPGINFNTVNFEYRIEKS